MKKRILMHCANGYIFGEYFKPMITDLISDFDIEFLQGDAFLKTTTLDALKDFSAKENNFSYQLLHIMETNEPALQYHRRMRQLMDILQKKSFDLLVVSTDCNVVDLYLINFARSKGIKVVIVHANIMHPEVIYSYRKNKGIGDSSCISEELRSKTSGIFIRARTFGRKLKRRWDIFANYCLFPWISSRVVFKESKYDRYRFTSGRADMVICYDAVDVEALKSTISTVKNVYLAKHPSLYNSRDVKKEVPKRLLVLLSAYAVELSQEQIIFWSKSIKAVFGKVTLDEIHLRFHPRTNEKLTWPGNLIDSISNLGCKVVIVNSDEVSLAESAAGYIGVIGAMSGSIRTARAACRGFVIGLLGASGEPCEKEWMLGSSEGISWIKDNDQIKDEHIFTEYKPDYERPKVSEILRQSLEPVSSKSRKIAAIIQARMNSTRLPGKVLMKVAGRFLLDYMVERVKQGKHVDQVIIATTISMKDEPIVEWCRENSIAFYRGPEEDVLARYYQAAKEYDVSTIVRVTSDCPLIDARVIDRAVGYFIDHPDIDFVSSTTPLPCLYPDGMDVDVFDNELLEKTHLESKLPSEREHVTFYIWKSGKFKTHRIDPEQDYSKYRFCIDYPQDFEVIKEVLTKLYTRNPKFSMYELIEFMNQNSALLEIQKGIIRNAGWERAFTKDREVIKKSL